MTLKSTLRITLVNDLSSGPVMEHHPLGNLLVLQTIPIQHTYYFNPFNSSSTISTQAFPLWKHLSLFYPAL